MAGQRKERELEEANKAPCGLSSEPADHCFCHLLLSKGKSQGQPKFTESRKTLPLCGRSHNAREWTQTRKELYAFLTVYLNLYFKNSYKQCHKLTQNVVICTFVVICSVWSSAKRIVALVSLEILVSLREWRSDFRYMKSDIYFLKFPKTLNFMFLSNFKNALHFWNH